MLGFCGCDVSWSGQGRAGQGRTGQVIRRDYGPNWKFDGTNCHGIKLYGL